MTARILVVDACCLLNLLATGRELELAVALDATFLVTPQAHGETRYLCGPPDPDVDGQPPTQIPVELSPLMQAQRLEVHALSEADAEAFIACASHLRDADASSVALAATRHVPLASDDGKVKKIARRLYPEMEVISTLQIIREAVEHVGIVGEPLKQLLQDLCTRGNFSPPRRDPARAWFEALK